MGDKGKSELYCLIEGPMKYFLMFVVFGYGLNSFAHSGGTDSDGCHTNHKTGQYHCHNPKKSIERNMASDFENDEVVFNTKTKKYHRPRCKSAKSCTVNCVPMLKADAIAKGGVPCGNCGG
jgi:hypothetical protein